MKTASANLTSHIAQDVTKLAMCWRVERTDGTVLAFTDHDRDIIYDAITYKADTGFSRSDFKYGDTLDVPNMDVIGILDSAEISEEDLRARKYFGAEIYCFVINWDSVTDGIIMIMRGWLGEVSMEDGVYTTEFRGLCDAYKNSLLEIVTPECQADFGDTRCGFDLDTVKFTGTIDTVTDRKNFTTSGVVHSSDNQFQAGTITFTSGLNNGLTFEVKYSTAGSQSIELYLNAAFTISNGDVFELFQGCKKTLEDCKAYSNIINYQGFPYTIGDDRHWEYPNAYA